jgi:putative PIN family toxin of toxin-antitoxin system
MPTVVVFDTNVVLSAIGWKGRPYECLELARKGLVTGITCQELLDELVEKLEAKLLLTPDESLAIVADLLTFLRTVSITGQSHFIDADPDDDKVVECTIAAGASYLVTGDRRHLLPLGTFRGIVILSPAEFLERMSNSPSD